MAGPDTTPIIENGRARQLLEPGSTGRARSHGRSRSQRGSDLPLLSLRRPPPGLGFVPSDSDDSIPLPPDIKKELKKKTNDYKQAVDNYVQAKIAQYQKNDIEKDVH